jgi:hypothetical protein
MQRVMLEVSWVLQGPARGQYRLAVGLLALPKTPEICTCKPTDEPECSASWHGIMLRPSTMLG